MRIHSFNNKKASFRINAIFESRFAGVDFSSLMNSIEGKFL